MQTYKSPQQADTWTDSPMRNWLLVAPRIGSNLAAWLSCCMLPRASPSMLISAVCTTLLTYSAGLHSQAATGSPGSLHACCAQTHAVMMIE